MPERSALPPMRLIAVAGSTARLALALRLHGIRASGATCEGNQPVLHTAGEIRLGEHLAIRGRIARVELGAERGGKLTVGNHVFINQGAVIVASLDIQIGSHCHVGDFACIYDSDFHPVDSSHPTRRSPTRLEDNVWLARSVIVLPGVTIGTGSVIAAGSVVTEDVAPHALYAGNPARLVRRLSSEDGWIRK